MAQATGQARLPASVVLVAILGLIATGLSWAARPIFFDGTLAVLALGVVLSESFAVRLPNGGTQSISYPLFIAILVLYGPAAVAISAALASTIADSRARKPPIKTLFNAGQLALSAVVAGLVFERLADYVGLSAPAVARLDGAAFPEVLVPALAYSMCVFIVNSALVSTVIAMSQGEHFLRVWRGSYSWQTLTQLALTVVGLALAKLVVLRGLLGVLLFAVPMLVSRGVFQSYIGLREAYADTVRALVSAIEAKDPYTRGHSERVSTYAMRIAERMGMPDNIVEQLELSALLHDLGKIGVDRNILQKPGRLTEEEWRMVRAHPRIGAEIVADVPFLQDAVPAIVHHHERWDGKGYAEGLSDAAIPLHARILAVADSFDAMTSDRPYKLPLTQADAIREILDGAGGQFDPAVVDAFMATETASHRAV